MSVRWPGSPYINLINGVVFRIKYGDCSPPVCVTASETAPHFIFICGQVFLVCNCGYYLHVWGGF